MDKAALIIFSVFVAGTIIGYLIYLIETYFYNRRND